MDNMNFDYYYGDESNQFSFYRIPRQLITGSDFKRLSTDAKLLYGLLLDRMGLSAKNGWYDDAGRVFIYYTLDEIQEDLNCGHDKAVKLLSELDKGKGFGLIERVKQGQGRPAKIYVKRFTTEELRAFFPGRGPLPPETLSQQRMRYELPGRAFAQAAADGGCEVWRYEFDWSAPNSIYGACHCLELPFLFGNLAGTHPFWREAIERSWSGCGTPCRAHGGVFSGGRRRMTGPPTRQRRKPLIRETTSACLGLSVDVPKNTPGSEDFAYMTDRVLSCGGKACFVGVAVPCASNPHTDTYDFDERGLVTGNRPRFGSGFCHYYDGGHQHSTGKYFSD